jgi:uncharacterized membrane protein YphA (DoxX/SURF4 family)
MSPTALLTLALSLGLSLLLGGVFVSAALPKLRHPKGFLLTVLEYRILPEGTSRLYARIVPPFELLAALLLFAGVAVRPAALLLGLLLLSFLIAVGVNLARGRDLDCGCFGSGQAKSASRRIGPGLVLQDLGLLAASLLLAAMISGTTSDWLGAAPWSVAKLLARLAGISVADALVFVACLALTGWLTLALPRAGRRGARKRRGGVAPAARR